VYLPSNIKEREEKNGIKTGDVEQNDAGRCVLQVIVNKARAQAKGQCLYLTMSPTSNTITSIEGMGLMVLTQEGYLSTPFVMALR